MSKEVQKYERESFSMYVCRLLLWHLAYALTTSAYPSHGLHMFNVEMMKGRNTNGVEWE